MASEKTIRSLTVAAATGDLETVKSIIAGSHPSRDAEGALREAAQVGRGDAPRRAARGAVA